MFVLRSFVLKHGPSVFSFVVNALSLTLVELLNRQQLSLLAIGLAFFEFNSKLNNNPIEFAVQDITPVVDDDGLTVLNKKRRTLTVRKRNHWRKTIAGTVAAERALITRRRCRRRCCRRARRWRPCRADEAIVEKNKFTLFHFVCAPCFFLSPFDFVDWCCF